MSQKALLENTLVHTLHANGSRDAVYTLMVKGPSFDIAIKPEQMYEAFGIGQLGIVWYAIEMIRSNQIHHDQQAVLRDEYKRPGTGILQYCEAGMSFRVEELLSLILIESDITATNLLLPFLGTQREINAWLKEQGLKTTGLNDRDDHLFESDAQRPNDMMTVLDRLKNDLDIHWALGRSHFRNGMRGFNSKDRNPHRQTIVRTACKVLNQTQRSSIWLQDRLLGGVERTPKSNVASLKEGIHPNFGGQSYLHEVGWFAGSHPLQVVLCSIDLDRMVVQQIGQILHEWSQEGVRVH